MPSTPFKYSNLDKVKHPRYVEPCCAVAGLHWSINNTIREHTTTLSLFITANARQRVLLFMLPCKAGLIAHGAAENAWLD
jgi:hypothetical protein